MQDNKALTESVKNNKKGVIIYITTVCLLLIMLILIITIPKTKESEDDITPVTFSVDTICELATLKCYYHNVAEFEQHPQGLFKFGLFKYGYKKFWIEYDGIVTLGIDAKDVVVKEPNDKGVVQIYIPDAKILGVDCVVSSISDIIVDKGVLDKVSSEDTAEAYAAAQKSMNEAAKNDVRMLKQARDNAKELIQRYIVGVGKQMNVNYVVEWIEMTNNVDEEGK